ncbi:unnamed protein product, partial [Larinioides sclopetarius]
FLSSCISVRSSFHQHANLDNEIIKVPLLRIQVPSNLRHFDSKMIKMDFFDWLTVYEHEKQVMNFVMGLTREREYIATQGPVRSSVFDFWHMKVQENTSKIVMLANLVEGNQEKVAKYWPDDARAYGDVIVTKLAEKQMENFGQTVRVFGLQYVGERFQYFFIRLIINHSFYT